MTTLARTTVVVSPRERFSPIIESLKSLFATVSPDVPVVVVDGAYPASLRAELRELSRTRPFHHEVREWPLAPNQARNIGTDLVKTEFVAYSDNDMIYEPGWLQALEAHADRTGVEVVAPLICIGPPTASIIHHAGGTLYVHEDGAGVHVLRVGHNLINRPVTDLANANLPDITDSGEFHATFVRTSFMRKLGVLDERLMTREHIDFALRVKHAGGRVGFEPRAIVTYNARTELKPDDLSYHVFRWNHRDAVLSLDTFERTWGVHLERDRILKGWIRNHRQRRIVEAFSAVRRWVGFGFVRNVVAPVVEWQIMRKSRARVERRFPNDIPLAERKALFADLVRRNTEPVRNIEIAVH